MLQETGDVIWLRPDRLTKSNTFTGLNAITITITNQSMSMVPNAATNMATAKNMTTKLTRTAKTAIMATTTTTIAITAMTMITITGAIVITVMTMITITGAIVITTTTMIIITTTIAITAIIIIIIMNIAKVWSGRDRRRQVGMPHNLSLELSSPKKLMNLAGSRNSNCSWKLAQASPTFTCGATAAALKSAYIMTKIR
jgi:hypothetical protein